MKQKTLVSCSILITAARRTAVVIKSRSLPIKNEDNLKTEDDSRLIFYPSKLFIYRYNISYLLISLFVLYNVTKMLSEICFSLVFTLLEIWSLFLSSSFIKASFFSSSSSLSISFSSFGKFSWLHRAIRKIQIKEQKS